MISYQEALHLVLDRLRPLPAIEVALEQAAGLVLAADLAARWDMPTSDHAAMDGFAFAWRDGLAGMTLRVAGSVYAGTPWQGRPPGPHEAVRIMTGSPLPPGCDSVIPLEDVVASAESIRLPATVNRGQHVRRQGEEFRVGECLLKAGTPLHAWEIGLLATAGFTHVRVHPAPCVALLSTGDELVPLGQTPGPGQIVNSNFYLLSACLRQAGCEVVALGPCRDEPELLARQLEAAKPADLILSTGGVSVGDRDYLRTALAALGFETAFWQVAIKPGKPLLFGFLDDRPLFGLPGNPAAAAATFELFVRPALRRLAGHPLVCGEMRKGVLTEAVRGDSKREAFLWCRLEWGGDHYRIHVPTRQGSGQNRSLQEVNALLSVPAGVEKLAAGDVVEVKLFRGAGFAR